MITGQKFTWLDQYDNKKHFLLMPNEAKEFHELIERGLSLEYAFERLTGQDCLLKKEVKLVQEYIIKLHLISKEVI